MNDRFKKAMGVLAASLVLTLSLAGCGGESSAPAGEEGGGSAAVTGTVATNGSTSMEKVVGVLAEQFMMDNGGVSVSYDPTGSGTGIESVRTGSCDIGLSSRGLKEEEADGGLTGTVVALDGIAIIVNEASPVEDLSLEDIAALFTGSVTDWSQVGGQAGAVACIGREAGSGTRDGFEAITGTEDACVLVQELTSTGAVLEAVKSNPNAIGYASLASAEGQEGIKLITVDGVSCTESAVVDGSYPIQRPFLLVTRADSELSAAAQAFFDFALSAEAHDLIRAAGAVPAR